MNPLRERRLLEIQKRLHTKNLDIGAGSFPITPESITVDIQPSKNPDILCDITKGIPVPDSSFDSVTALEILEHFHPVEQMDILRDIYRILCPGGQLLVSVPNASRWMIGAQKLVWFLRENTTQREYHNNELSHAHIGMLPPEKHCRMIQLAGFQITERKRLMLYDYIIKATRL